MSRARIRVLLFSLVAAAMLVVPAIAGAVIGTPMPHAQSSYDDGAGCAEADRCQSAFSGSSVTYGYTLANDGNADLTSAEFTIDVDETAAPGPAQTLTNVQVNFVDVTCTAGASGVYTCPVPGGTIAAFDDIFVEAIVSTTNAGYSGTAAVAVTLTGAAATPSTYTDSTPWVRVNNADLRLAASGPTDVPVPAEGANVTYTATITNDGPDAAPSAVAYFTIPFQATLVSGTAGGVAVTCTPSDQSSANYEKGKTGYGCPSGALAAHATRVITLTMHVKEGEGRNSTPLKLPSTFGIDIAAGFDIMDYGANTDPNSANDSATVTTKFAAPSVVVVPPTNDTSGNDVIDGTETADRLHGGTGNDTVYGGGGNDRLYGDSGTDRLFGGIGADFLFGGTGSDTLQGGSGNDNLNGGNGNDHSYGGSGNDKVSGGPGADITRGGVGNDTVTCGTGTDRAYGDSGNDTIGCSDGKRGDYLVGGPGRDTCIGDKGDHFVGCERIVRH